MEEIEMIQTFPSDSSNLIFSLYPLKVASADGSRAKDPTGLIKNLSRLEGCFRLD